MEVTEDDLKWIEYLVRGHERLQEQAEQDKQDHQQAVVHLLEELYGDESRLPGLTSFYTESVLLPLEHLTVEMLAEGDRKRRRRREEAEEQKEGNLTVFRYRYSHRQSVSLVDVLSLRFWQMIVKVGIVPTGLLNLRNRYNARNKFRF